MQCGARGLPNRHATVIVIVKIAQHRLVTEIFQQREDLEHVFGESCIGRKGKNGTGTVFQNPALPLVRVGVQVNRDKVVQSNRATAMRTEIGDLALDDLDDTGTVIANRETATLNAGEQDQGTNNCQGNADIWHDAEAGQGGVNTKKGNDGTGIGDPEPFEMVPNTRADEIEDFTHM